MQYPNAVFWPDFSTQTLRLVEITHGDRSNRESATGRHTLSETTTSFVTRVITITPRAPGRARHSTYPARRCPLIRIEIGTPDATALVAFDRIAPIVGDRLVGARGDAPFAQRKIDANARLTVVPRVGFNDDGGRKRPAGERQAVSSVVVGGGKLLIRSPDGRVIAERRAECWAAVGDIVDAMIFAGRVTRRRCGTRFIR